MTILEAKHLKKTFDGVRALNDANFSLRKGEICGLVGANGSGKTTFARIISGLLIPDGGELFLYDAPVNLKSHLKAEEYKLAMVHQNLSLVSEMTIWENITLGREETGKFGFVKNNQAMMIAQHALDQLGVRLSIYEKVVNIAPDEKQLVEIAKALTKQANILILDEPTASLGFQQVKDLFTTINALKQQGVSIIFISHRIWEITKICDRLVVFRNGETVGELDFETQERDEQLIIPLITGQSGALEDTRGKEERTQHALHLQKADYALEVTNLSLHRKLHEISFSVKKGEILGIGGLQGQGQEELLLILAGFLRRSSGTIAIQGKPLKIKHTRHAIREGMVLVPGDRQKEGLFLLHTVFTNLTYPRVAMHKGTLFLPLEKLKKEVDKLIQTISLSPSDPKMMISHLSGGNQQKVVVGKWLALSPKILLLSDPTKGVDVGTRSHLYAMIAELAAQGTSVILYASDNEELIAHCDRILIMFEGRIVDEIGGEEISEDRIIASSLNIQGPNHSENRTGGGK